MTDRCYDSVPRGQAWNFERRSDLCDGFKCITVFRRGADATGYVRSIEASRPLIFARSWSKIYQKASESKPSAWISALRDQPASASSHRKRGSIESTNLRIFVRYTNFGDGTPANISGETRYSETLTIY